MGRLSVTDSDRWPITRDTEPQIPKGFWDRKLMSMLPDDMLTFSPGDVTLAHSFDGAARRIGMRTSRATQPDGRIFVWLRK